MFSKKAFEIAGIGLLLFIFVVFAVDWFFGGPIGKAPRPKPRGNPSARLSIATQFSRVGRPSRSTDPIRPHRQASRRWRRRWPARSQEWKPWGHLLAWIRVPCDSDLSDAPGGKGAAECM